MLTSIPEHNNEQTEHVMNHSNRTFLENPKVEPNRAEAEPLMGLARTIAGDRTAVTATSICKSERPIKKLYLHKKLTNSEQRIKTSELRRKETLERERERMDR